MVGTAELNCFFIDASIRSPKHQREFFVATDQWTLMPKRLRDEDLEAAVTAGAPRDRGVGESDEDWDAYRRGWLASWLQEAYLPSSGKEKRWTSGGSESTCPALPTVPQRREQSRRRSSVLPSRQLEIRTGRMWRAGCYT